ncbi:hypothetical protein SxD43FB_17755 [Sphingobium sp. D43FB]|nr:hypothetical protein SxD43FB_17755 [Sphingobium sp. D43FB]
MDTEVTILTHALTRDGEFANMTKTHVHTVDGWVTQNYDRALTFNAVVETIQDIECLSELLTLLEAAPHACIVRGQPTGPTHHIRRLLYDNDQSPATLRANPAGLRWVMLDFDKVPVGSLALEDSDARLAYLVSLLPPEFHDVSYHYQWSSSAGVRGWDTLSCHLWFMLEAAWFCSDLHTRFERGDFRDIEVDAAPFVANQVHYTAAPVFVGGVDPMEKHRSGLVRRSNDTVRLSPWTKPVCPPPPPSCYLPPRPSGAAFEDLLADIGPNYHRPILRAAAHYAAVTPGGEYDANYLRDRLCAAIHAGAQGKNRKSDYLNRNYLDRVIHGAEAKFGRAF